LRRVTSKLRDNTSKPLFFILISLLPGTRSAAPQPATGETFGWFKPLNYFIIAARFAAACRDGPQYPIEPQSGALHHQQRAPLFLGTQIYSVNQP
jgi:hypothetical protein